MQRHQRPVSRPVAFILKGTIVIPLVIAVLFLAPAARTEGAQTPNPGNVLVIPNNASGFFRPWTTIPTATPTATAAAPRPAQRPQRVRVAKTKVRVIPVAAEAAVSEPQPAEPAWPNAAETVGTGSLTPITVKTVREMIEPAPDTNVVFENELSDIDLAAQPLLTATSDQTSAPVTDGRATAETDVSELPRVFAMTETMKTFTQSAWLEPVLLVLAGALAAVSALRLFA